MTNIICIQFLMMTTAIYCQDVQTDVQPEDDDDTTAQVVVETRVAQKTFNITHDFTVSQSVEYFVKFEVPEEAIEIFERSPEMHIFQVNINSSESDERHPVEVTVRQFKRMKTFQLPSYERKGNRTFYKSTERSVDFCPIADIDSNSTVTVSISTESVTPVQVSVRVLIKGRNADWKEKFTENGKEYHTKTTIKPVISRIRYFDTKLIEANSIIIKVTTRNDTNCLCSVISIQEPTCPFYDDVGSAMRFGRWSTMMDTGVMIIDPSDYPDGFILVLVASAHPELCETKSCDEDKNLVDPRKRVKVTITSNGDSSQYIIATMSIIGFYIAIFILTISFSVIEFRYKSSDFDQFKENIREKIEQNVEKIKETLDFGPVQAKLSKKISLLSSQSCPPESPSVKEGFSVLDGLKSTGEIVSKPQADLNIDDDEIAPLASGRESLDVTLDINDENFEMQYIDNAEDDKGNIRDSFIASADNLRTIDPEIDLTDDKAKRRLKKNLYVSDLSTKLKDPTRTKSVYQKSQLYLGVIFLISIYYSLPVLQMVLRFSAEQRLTGNQDICYYNDLCRKPLGQIRDFNHVFSNLGYCVFGILFMCIVLFKKLKYESFLSKCESIQEDEYGVPCQYGLYFAMGLALTMEGVMSSSYHICPTDVTFQFDTTFMYLLAVLMFMKLYQVRHADVSANAIGVVFGLGIALILETISLYYSGPAFWAIFCSIYIIVIIVVAVHAYNIGVVKYNYKILWVVAKLLFGELRKLWRTKKEEEGKDKSQKARPRLVCLLLIALVNIILCLYFGITGTSGASNYLLIIFFLNLVLYGSYYCAMKITNGERINWISITYANLGLVCFLPAMYFFTQKEKMTEKSPSESRNMNGDCFFLDFFDGHDVWHFLGAAGVFFAFLCVFTLDEDLKGKKRSSIKVF